MNIPLEFTLFNLHGLAIPYVVTHSISVAVSKPPHKGLTLRNAAYILTTPHTPSTFSSFSLLYQQTAETKSKASS
jgi:hypothetical protein